MGVNLSPVADANGPYTGVAGVAVTLDGSGSSDPDGTIVNCEWDLDNDGEFDDATGEVIQYTWAAAYSGNISLRVTDDAGATDIDTTTATITTATQCVVTFNFADQNGYLTGTGEERVYVDGFGWKADGGQITVKPGDTISYRAYFKEGSGLYGPKVTFTVTGTMTLDVMFHTLTMDFENQNGDLNAAAGIGTGEERVYIDNVGYKADGDNVTVPLNSAVAHRAYFKQGSGLYGPKNTTNVDGSFTELKVLFYTLTMDFEDQSGDLNPAGGIGTGEERVYIDNVGYKADGGTVAVPLGSTVYHRAYYKEGSGLYGPKNTTNIDGTSGELRVLFHTLTMDFEDQSGDLNAAAGIGTGEERVYIDNVGYKADGDNVTVPLNSAVAHRAYFKQGSGLYGPKNTTSVDGSFTELKVLFRSISFEVVDSNTKDPIGGAQVYVDNVGYISNSGTIIVPFGSTIQHKAKVGNTWSAVNSKLIDASWSKCTYEWDGVGFSPPGYE